MEPLEEKEKMPTSGIGKNNSGFTLIELLLVLILIGVSSSYIMLNTDLIGSFKSSGDTAEDYFERMTNESILRGRTLHWFLSNEEERIYLDDFFTEASMLHSDELNFLKIIPSNSEVTIKTGNGTQYRINKDLTPIPMISFYPSGETSGAIIAVNHPNGTYKVLVRTNGEVDRVEE